MFWTNNFPDPLHPTAAVLGLLVMILATTLLARAKAHRHGPPTGSFHPCSRLGLAPALEHHEADPMSRSSRFVSDTHHHVNITQDPSRECTWSQLPATASHYTLALFLQPRSTIFVVDTGFGIN